MSEMTQRPLVQLKNGAIRGKADSGIAAFLGVPYAAAPFGANRMRPPQPVPPWIQTSTGSPPVVGSGVHTFRFRQPSPGITTSGNNGAYCGG